METNEDTLITPFRVLPDTCIELFINYTGKPLAIIEGNDLFINKRSFITSRMSHFMNVQMQEGISCIAICFRSALGYKFFPLPMLEVSDRVTELADIWQHMAAELEDRVANAPTDQQRVDIVQQYLLAQLIHSIHDRQIMGPVQSINLLKGQVSVKALSKESNISERQLSRKFQQFIGLSPKEYAQVHRFLHSLQLLKENTARSLTHITYESGYYDQAHFIHECRKYSGFAPRELLSSKNVLY